ncbi:hypothetical protein Lgra_2845 [Legionella gratiana]|uniref:Uncharacterized protein n=1 Tax=Legionella gratiana TaxID=45066 RepID=A0A378J576_9GAMM|nr:hypothetical protein [Legionella gratiana]KTD06068.1 hypothetical protein Lgra_2845 [Legionella gratiana]STX42775.1 Uncharacterised protein [Legionella gratiana]
MKYTVTFCVFDHTVEGNPFWHGSFFLSKLDDSKQLLEVAEAWGFYGVTSTTDKKSWWGKLKTKLALDVDFQGNHGWLTHEEVRFMDLGHGLHGYTFEITEEQFNELQKRCTRAVADQEAAIKEVVGSEKIPSDSARKVRFYKEEPVSKHIFEIEKYKAKMEGRQSRLKPFDLHVSLGFWGPSLEKSHTCKSEALNLLEGILTEEQLAPFKATSLPRFISGLEPIFLHSTGKLHTHTRSSGKEVFYRDGHDEDVKLYWSVPPQHFEALSEDTVDLFSIDPEYVSEVKSMVSKLQRLEWSLRNASLPMQYQEYKDSLIDKVIACYKAFAIMEPKKDTKISGWQGFALSLFSLPRSKEEKKLQDKIHQAKMLLNSIYMAIVDGWEIDDNYPSEVSATEHDEDYNPLEAIVSYLSIDDKKKLCQILGRSYVESEEYEEMSDESLSVAAQR